jgi:hypothetical protein
MTEPLKTFLIALVVAGAARAVPLDEPPTGAKELFFDPQQELNSGAVHSGAVKPRRQPTYDSSGRRTPHSTDHATQRALGLSYWIELADADGTPFGPVTDEHTFKSGDRIRLHFRGNTDGRILLVQLGSSGTSSVLFPDPAKGMTANALRANDDHVLPAPTHWFKFDASPGTEKLLVLFAKSQSELDRALPTRASMDAVDTATLLQAADHIGGGKDLMIETETQRASEVGTYAVNVSGKPIVLQIVLKHH